MEYNWFMMMCSWEWEHDSKALNKFGEVYKHLNIFNTSEWDSIKADPNNNDLRKALNVSTLKAFNLIGQRKFVIVGETTSNKVLQQLSSMITLGTPIKVEIFNATYVHDFNTVNEAFIQAAAQSVQE